MDTLRYTALGDSISGGLTCLICDGFPYRLSRYLNNKCCSTKFNNFAKPRLTSHGLLNQLKKSKEIRHAVKHSDLITITIGGNNLLKCCSSNYCKINKKIADTEVQQFKEDWLCILDCIRNDIGSEAKICVMTLYNPYCCTDTNYDTAEHYIHLINRAISFPPLLRDYNYSAADVSDAFRNGNGDKWTFFNYPFSDWFRDPHPNYEGHRQITKTFIQCIEPWYDK